MALYYGQSQYRKEPTNDERFLKIQTLILLYSTKIFCVLVTIYFLWEFGSARHSALNQRNHLSSNSFLINQILESINVHVLIYPGEYLPGIDGSSFWIFVLIAILILTVTIFGIIGILLDSPNLLIPYLMYRWFLVFMLAVSFLVSFSNSNWFVIFVAGFSYMPTFAGFMNLFIPVALYLNNYFMVSILEIIVIVIETYSACVVSDCYESIVNRKRTEYIHNYEERLHLMFDQLAYYQSLAV